MKAFLRKAELLFTLAITVICLVILVMSFNLGFGSMKQPGPGFFTAFIGLFGMVFGILLTLRYLASPDSGTKGKIFQAGQMRRFLAMIATFCAWLILMPWMGFIIVTFLATFAFSKIMGEKGWGVPILLAIGGSIFIFFLFDVWFYADLPRGILGI